MVVPVCKVLRQNEFLMMTVYGLAKMGITDIALDGLRHRSQSQCIQAHNGVRLSILAKRCNIDTVNYTILGRNGANTRNFASCIHLIYRRWCRRLSILVIALPLGRLENYL